MITIDTLLEKTGQILTITTVRSMKVRKGRDPITKQSTFQARAGVTYDNMKSVKEKREDGRLPEENQGLPWGTWKLFPYIIEHKGEEYFRFSTVKTKFVPIVKYIRHGNEITAEVAKEECLASEFAVKQDLDVFNVKLSSIIETKG